MEGVIVFVLLVSVFLILVQYFPRVTTSREGFAPISYPQRDSSLLYQLSKPGTVLYYQGSQLPPFLNLTPPPADDKQTAKDKPAVSCRSGAPRALATFAFNKCDPRCCQSSPYTCHGGCVCVTKDQIQMLQTSGTCSKDTQPYFLKD
jgi:hypothetical protein